MSLGSASGFEAKRHEVFNSQSTPALPYTSSAHHGPVLSGMSPEPIEPPRRTKSESAVHQTRQSFRRSRRQPIDPTLERVSVTPEEPPHPGRKSPQYDVEDVLRKVLPRSEGTIKFPEFDAAGSYAESDVVSKMWHNETTRLMKIAYSPEMPLEFKSNGFLQGDTEKGYRDASNLSQKILTANAICLLDNECLNAEHCGQLSNQQKVSNLIEQVQKSQRATEAIAGGEGLEAQQHTMHSLAATYSLVNYIAAVLTRLIIRISPGSHWHKNVLSVLIRRITKIKLLLLDLKASSAIAVRAAQGALSKFPRSGDAKHLGRELDHEEELEEYLRMIEANEKEGTASYEEHQVASHCVEQNKYRFGLNSALRDMFMSVRFTNSSGLPATAFEICAVTYQGGFSNLRALLHQDRDFEYSATSDLDNLNTACSAFRILKQIVIHLGRKSEQREYPGSMGTMLGGLFYEEDSNIEDDTFLPLNSMDKVITVLIPLTTTNPAFLANLTSFRHVIPSNGLTRKDAQPLRERHFVADFCVRTSQYASQYENVYMKELNSTGLSQLNWVSSLHWWERHVRRKAKSKQQHQINELMGGWIVDEMSVTAPCPGYVWSVIAVASLLAGGGLGIGFSVGERINGVDPSNLATYLWVVAAFTVLIAKNMKVKEWTWNDFLRRRVRCCSVSELQSMTGMDGQLIISKLLYDERWGSVLNIRGPYNSAFLRRANEGFSIDEPISLSTLIGSGLMMLKVATSRGPALVCLDFRTGTNLSVIGHTPDPQREYLMYERIDSFQFRDVGFGMDVRANAKHEFSRSSELKWTRVLGIYNSRNSRNDKFI